MEKETAAGAIKGQFDLSGTADLFGDYVPTLYVNYNLNDREDRINVHYDYELSPYSGGTSRAGTTLLTYADLEPYNGRSCDLDLDYSDGTAHELWKAWYDQREQMSYCFDLPHYYLLGYAPPDGEELTVTRQRVADALTQQGYTRSVAGALNSSLYLQDGDIILFGTDAEPDPVTAPHYAVVLNGEIWSIFHWDQGGDFDGPRDPAFFLNRPAIENPYTGLASDPTLPFLYYAVYSR